MSKINEYNHNIDEYLERIKEFPEPSTERSFLANELDSLMSELKYLATQERDKIFTLKLFQIYQKLYSIVKRAKFHYRYFQELFDWFEKCYKYGYGNVDYCKYYIQFDIWIQTFCENLNAYIDADIDCNDDYIPLLNINEYYDYAKFIVEDFKKYIYRWEKLQELFSIQNRLPNSMKMVVSQVIRRDLSVKRFSEIINKLNSFLKLSESEQKKKTIKYKNEIIEVATKISENDKINNADISDRQKQICDFIWLSKSVKVSHEQIAQKFGYSGATIKKDLNAIYLCFDITGTENNKKKDLLNLLNQ